MRFSDILLEKKSLDELYNQVYNSIIKAYLTKINN
jgi:hypothetical protein